MNSLPVAIQVYSVRDCAQSDFLGTLKKLREMGYDGVELAGMYGMSARQVRDALDEAGLPCVSAHVPYSELADKLEKTLEDYALIGCRYIAIPYMAQEYRPSGTDDYGKVLESIREIGRAANAHGMTLLYHNHDFEFETMPDGTFALDYLYSSVDPSLLQTELDTCWVKVAGQDPAAYVEKYAGRAPVVHLKDYKYAGAPEDGAPYDLIGKPEGKQAGRGSFQFTAVGHGTQDFPPILAAALKAGACWVVVEQDRSVERSTLQDARLSREYLRGLGW